MSKLNSKQARALAVNFISLAESMSEYRYHHKESLSPSQKENLKNLHDEISYAGKKMLAISTTLAMIEVEKSLSQINNITIEINKSITKLENTQKVINVATSIVKLGAAIVGKDPATILTSITGVEDAWKV